MCAYFLLKCEREVVIILALQNHIILFHHPRCIYVYCIYMCLFYLYIELNYFTMNDIFFMQKRHWIYIFIIRIVNSKRVYRPYFIYNEYKYKNKVLRECIANGNAQSTHDDDDGDNARSALLNFNSIKLPLGLYLL